jgi:hypothetical protein|tara:strand:- start:69 stop:719 length:651 start_codon:yes stop_codon:yes gene_type:complete
MNKYVLCVLLALGPAMIFCQQCPQDLNNNGVIDGGDLLELLSLYGQICNPALEFAPVISEIHYNPSFEQGPDSEWEFVEIYNPYTVTIDISGWYITDEVEAPFAEGTHIEPGRYVLITADIDSYAGELPYATQLVEFSSGTELSNNGGIIRLVNDDGVEIDRVQYSDFSEWPTEPDGDGPSLEWRGIGFDNSLPSSWLPSNSFGGSPGAPNSTWAD